MKIEKFKYYVLDDYMDVCHKDQIFKVAFRTKEQALKQAEKYLSKIITYENSSLWFKVPKTIRDKYREFEFRSVNEKIIDKKSGFCILYGIEFAKVNKKTIKSTVEVDGKEYSREEEIIEYKEWQICMYEQGYYADAKPVSGEYSIYCEENILEMFVED